MHIYGHGGLRTTEDDWDDDDEDEDDDGILMRKQGKGTETARTRLSVTVAKYVGYSGSSWVSLRWFVVVGVARTRGLRRTYQPWLTAVLQLLRVDFHVELESENQFSKKPTCKLLV